MGTFEEHIRMLQDENAKLADNVRVKRDQISKQVIK